MNYRIGDRLRLKNGNHVFTVEEISDDGWVWGSDLPEPYFHTRTNVLHKNFHNPSDSYLELVVRVKPWAGSIIKFNFT